MGAVGGCAGEDGGEGGDGFEVEDSAGLDGGFVDGRDAVNARFFVWI